MEKKLECDVCGARVSYPKLGEEVRCYNCGTRFSLVSQKVTICSSCRKEVVIPKFGEKATCPSCGTCYGYDHDGERIALDDGQVPIGIKRRKKKMKC
ncbi:MAG: hypothetical protein MUC28_02545 [Planctomycetes bacterium]|jgi:DNA-directed RNA polymerase subunit RPC12/RpoP|nr:hypothetical protein [Planctomycetota bacterium]